jgi:hypothetical protein
MALFCGGVILPRPIPARLATRLLRTAERDIEYVVLADLAAQGSLYGASWSVSSWARLKGQKLVNRTILAEVGGLSISLRCLANGSDGYVYPIKDLTVWRFGRSGASTTAAVPRGTRIRLVVRRAPTSTVLGTLEQEGAIALLPDRVEGAAPRFLVLVNARVAVLIANTSRRHFKARSTLRHVRRRSALSQQI